MKKYFLNYGPMGYLSGYLIISIRKLNKKLRKKVLKVMNSGEVIKSYFYAGITSRD